MVSEAKVAKVAEIKDRLSGASTLVLADYRGLNVKEMQELRRELRASGCDITIYKNRLAKLALDELGEDALDGYLVGPTAFVMTDGDPVGLAKALAGFAKEHPALEVKAGMIDGALVTAEDIGRLSKLPSRDELVAKFMGMLLNPVRGFMAQATAPAGAFVRVMDAVARQKQAA